jgi:phage shock protein E
VKHALPLIVMLAMSAALGFAEGQAEKIDVYRDPARLAALVDSTEPAHIVVDVRTPEEYASGHIPTAINIPVGEIGSRPPTRDTNALIIVYCASGRRSSRAKAVLEGLGYTRVVDFGGISRWTGSTVTEDPQ